MLLSFQMVLYYRNKSKQQRNAVMKSSEAIIELTIYERPIAAEPTVDPHVQPNMRQDYENLKQERHNYETIKFTDYENV